MAPPATAVPAEQPAPDDASMSDAALNTAPKRPTTAASSDQTSPPDDSHPPVDPHAAATEPSSKHHPPATPDHSAPDDAPEPSTPTQPPPPSTPSIAPSQTDSEAPSSAHRPSVPAAPLLSLLSGAPSSAARVVTSWLEHLSANGPTAVARVLSLVAAAGRPIAYVDAGGLVAQKMIVDNNPGATIERVARTMAADQAGRVPVLAKDVASKRVRRAFEDFWARLAPSADDFVLFDTDCFDALISWLEAMAGASSRGLRTAACLAAYRMVDGLVDVGNQLRKRLASMQRQLATERRKCGVTEGPSRARARGRPPGGSLSKKGQDLARKVEELTAHISEVGGLCDKVFRSIFILKYRDVAPEIRVISVSALGGWIAANPEHFLDDVHSKYIGWLLSDKEPSVRRASLDVLMKMLRRPDFFSILELFLERFCNRIVEMARDKDDGVAVAAIELLSRLVAFGLVDDDSRVAICDMAAEETHLGIRRAAGAFLGSIITADEGGDAVPVGKRKNGQAGRKPKRSADGPVNPDIKEIPSLEDSAGHIRSLLVALTYKSDSVSAQLLVDAVWDHVPALRCWDAFDALLQDKGIPYEGDDTELTTTDKGILCEMLLQSVVEASGKGDPERAKLVKLGEYNSEETPGVLLTLQLLPVLPKLLTQFQGDERAMKALVKLPEFFAPQAFEREGQEQHFSELMNRLVDALTRHTAYAEVTNKCGETFRELISDKNPLKSLTSSALQVACKSASNELCVEIRSDISSVDPDSVAAAVLRVRVLSELVEPSTAIHVPLKKLLKYQVETEDSELSEDTTIDATRIAMSSVVWSLLRIRSRLETLPGSGASLLKFLQHDEISEVRAHGFDVVDQFVSMCPMESLPFRVKGAALTGLLTILTLSRGIERYAMSEILPSLTRTEEDQIERNNIEDLDFLGVQPMVETVVDAIKACIVSIVKHERTHMHRKPARRGKAAAKDSATSSKGNDDIVKDCFITLAQAALQSVVAPELVHLPVLGLLLKPPKGVDEEEGRDFTTFSLCKQYYNRRQVRNGLGTKEEALLLKEVAQFEPSDQGMSPLAKDMCDALVSSKWRKENKASFAGRLLLALVEDALRKQPSEELMIAAVGLLSSVGPSLSAVLEADAAMKTLEKVKDLKLVLEDSSVAETGPDVLEAFEKLQETLESAAAGQHVVIREPARLGRPPSRLGARRGRGASRKNAMERRWSGGGAKAPAAVANGSRRQSGRLRKRVNYMRLGGLSSGEEDSEPEKEEEEEEPSDDGAEDADESGGQNTTEAAAELARGMMQFSRSPRTRPRLRSTAAVEEDEEDEDQDEEQDGAQDGEGGEGEGEGEGESADVDEAEADAANEEGDGEEGAGEEDGGEEDGGEDKAKNGAAECEAMEIENGDGDGETGRTRRTGMRRKASKMASSPPRAKRTRTRTRTRTRSRRDEEDEDEAAEAKGGLRESGSTRASSKSSSASSAKRDETAVAKGEVAARGLLTEKTGSEEDGGADKPVITRRRKRQW